MQAGLFADPTQVYIFTMRLRSLFSWVFAQWPAIALATSLSMLAIAHGFERFGGLAPCPLCLHQREVYWIAAIVAGLALVVRRMQDHVFASRAMNLLLALAFLSGAVVAGFHMGVEYKWWPGLAECGGVGASANKMPTDLLAALSGPMKVVGCDEPAWVFLGLSMAGWNFLISLKLMVYSGLSVLFPKGLIAAPPVAVTEKTDV